MNDVTKKRIVAIIVLSLVGFIGLWWNWHLLHTDGEFYPYVALICPALLVFAVYFVIVPDDPTVMPEMSALLILVYGLCVLLGAANWYALSHGLY